MTRSSGSVFVVIVNFRTGRLTAQCLASLADEVSSLRSGRVIVVDNCSEDDSVTLISSAIRHNGWERWAELLPLPRNGGFAYGYGGTGPRNLGHADGGAAGCGAEQGVSQIQRTTGAAPTSGSRARASAAAPGTPSEWAARILPNGGPVSCLRHHRADLRPRRNDCRTAVSGRSPK